MKMQTNLEHELKDEQKNYTKKVNRDLLMYKNNSKRKLIKQNKIKIKKQHLRIKPRTKKTKTNEKYI